MKPDGALAEFKRHASARSITDMAALTPRAALEVFLAFFQDVPAEGCDPENDGDMLLFQWGTYDWGEGEHFELNVTRQFMGPSGEDDEISQLQLTFSFESEPALRALGSGDRWCHDPQELGPFREFVVSSPAYAAVADRTDATVQLGHEYV